MPFDPYAPFVDQETGLAYEDLGEYILGRPKENTRNGNIRSYRRATYGEEAIRAYWQAFDRCEVINPVPGNNDFAQRHRAGIAAAKATGQFAPLSRREDLDGLLAAYNAKCATEGTYFTAGQS
jgi:hypothetical protein